MIYVANITTAKNTAKNALKRTNITVTKGLVYKVEFFFPPGSAGLMGVAVFDGLYQVWPSSVGEFFIGEDQVISFDDMYLTESAPYQFQFYTYNLDDTHSHMVSVRIGLVSKDVFLARFMPTKSADFLSELLVKMGFQKELQIRILKETLPMTPAQWIEDNVEPAPEEKVKLVIKPVVIDPLKIQPVPGERDTPIFIGF